MVHLLHRLYGVDAPAHRTACGWSQVRIDFGPVTLCGPVPFAVTHELQLGFAGLAKQ